MGQIRHTTPILLLFCTLATALQPAEIETDLFERGMVAEFNGNYEEALAIWSQAEEVLDIPDARIGFEYIRLVTEQELIKHYERATELYYWSLQAPLTGPSRAAVRQEMDRLRTITGEGIYRQWRDWWESSDESVTVDIRGFWVLLDPTPETLHNERLIEHWVRIATARKHFVKNRNTPYHTDDRALIYIRYGEPQHIETGHFSIDNRRVGDWISRQFEFQQSTSEESPAVSEREDAFRQLEEYLFKFHSSPEYEIWIYPPFTDQSGDSPLFIFGTDIDRGGFYLQSGVDDFIPRRAFLSDRRAAESDPEFIRQGLTPALILQLLYFEQLLETHPYFKERFTRIREALIEQGVLAHHSLDLTLRSENREKLWHTHIHSPRQASTVVNLLPEIPISLYQYRLLDEENNPYLLTFIESKPAGALDEEADTMTDSLAGDSGENLQVKAAEISESTEIIHSFQVYDESWHVERPFSQRFQLEPEQVMSDFQLISGFRQPQTRQSFQSSSVQLLDRNLSERSISTVQSLFPPELRGLGSVHSMQPVPLNADRDELEIADLILGFRDELPENYPFSFRVANDQRIPAGESLVLHFEVYHLQPRPNGFTHFELTYRIYPVTDLGDVLSDQEEFYLTLNFESDLTRVIEDLEIETSSLQQQVYELQLFVQDNETLQTRSRSIRFEVSK